MYDSNPLGRLESTADSGLWLGQRIVLRFEMHFIRLILYVRKNLILFIYNSKVDGSCNQIRSGFYFQKYFLHKLSVHKAYFIIILKLRGPTFVTFAMTFVHCIATCRYNILFQNIT